MIDIVVRSIVEGEISEIARIKLSAQRVSMPYKKFTRSFEDECDYLQKTLERCAIEVAVASGRIVGFAAFGNGWLEQMFVDPDHYNQGIGTALLDQIRNASNHMKALVDLQNEYAIRFYESRGFVRQEKLIDTDAIVYEWTSDAK